MRWRVPVGLVLLAVCAACRSDWVRLGNGAQRYVNRAGGYAIDAPRPGPAGTWSRHEIEGADLSFRNARGSRMSLLSECGRGPAPAPVLARQLLIGIEGHSVETSHPIAHRGDSGWAQSFRTHEAEGGRLVEQPITVKTVTVIGGNCTYDWLLVSRGAFAAEEAVFDRWWASFRRGNPDELVRDGGAS